MNATVHLHRAPAAGFDEPFEMLAACHERVESMLTLLLKLADHLPVHGADEQARSAARDVMRYFDIAGPAHHEDEERHIFPPLKDDPVVGDVVRRLQAEHLQMEAQWPGVRADLVAVEQGCGPLPPGSHGRWATYAALYRRHIVDEDRWVYPAAHGRLDAATQAAMGDEMARRRGVR